MRGGDGTGGGEMGKARTWALRPAAGGLAAALLLGLILLPGGLAGQLRENATDRLLSGTAPQGGAVVVVDIDSATLAATDPWPWPRIRLAGLVERIMAEQPKAVGIDILLSGSDRFSPRRLAESLPVADADLKRRFAALPDTDATLGAALSARPTVLSALFSGEASAPPPPVPVLIAGQPPRLSPWAAPGALLPLPTMAASTAGIGISSLSGDQSGTVRSVPLMGTAGNGIAPGFAAELLRQATGASAYILDGDRKTLSIGEHALPLVNTVSMRFRPSTPAQWQARTVSALSLLSGTLTPGRLKDRIVILGGSAPELGALRITAASPLAPSVQIQADALETMLSGGVPVRPGFAEPVEAGAYLLLVLAGAVAGALLGPAAALFLTLALGSLWAGSAVVLLAQRALLLDPVSPVLGLVLAALTAAGISAIRQRRQAAAIRRRFEQHLSPAVVARMAENPGILRLEGERREITALFTDIEGFSSLADRIGPQALIALLDDYFGGMVEAIVRHGGMVDKFVGDAVHGIFNAPLDLDDHPRRALAAARAILDFTEAYRQTPRAVAAGLGRTRIGLECGEVVIGDVGAGDKVDYTAHGLAMNMAARLEALNKTFGTSILIGPGMAARLEGERLRSLGPQELRGCGTFEVFTPEGLASPA